jgi:putative DNA primase/helicase
MTIEQDFLNHALGIGISFAEPIIADGVLHRSHINGHRPCTKNGAYVIFINDSSPVGWGMDFKSGVEFTWSSRKIKSTLSLSQRSAIQQAKAEQALAIQHKQELAAQKAKEIWSHAIDAPLDTPYLLKKGIESYGARTGSKYSSLNDVLIIPVFSPNFTLVNLQFIQPDGEKRFLSGGRKKDCFWGLGTETRTILIAEGFATAASLHERTDFRCYIAFDAGNLFSVAKTVRQFHPHATIVIAGDNDLNGVGQKAATDAARAINGRIYLPPSPGTDWNDVLSTGQISGGVQ